MKTISTDKVKIAFAAYLLDEPAGEHGQYPYGLYYEAGDDTSQNDEVETMAGELGVEIEWAGSPDEDEDGNGYWPFRIA